MIDKAPNNEWKLIIALSRFGGLRIPSEIAGMKWRHIRIEEKRMIILSPKTSHHGEGHDQRVCPTFPEIEPYLTKAYTEAAEGDEYVISERLRLAPNLRKAFTAIIESAGLVAWAKLFQNLRASRATELADQFPSHVAAAWLGHAEGVADKHYRTVTDDHFADAVQNGANLAHYGATPSNTEQQSQPATNEKARKTGLSLVHQRIVKMDRWAMRDSNPRRILRNPWKNGASQIQAARIPAHLQSHWHIWPFFGNGFLHFNGCRFCN